MARYICTAEDIIADTLHTKPDVAVEVNTAHGFGQLVRWRQFIGSYKLPPLPTAVMSVHLGGTRTIRYKDGDIWSEKSSIPGTVTIVPSGVETEWLINGELDCATFSIGYESATLKDLPENFSKLSLGFSDPLSMALTRQIIAELYQPSCLSRDDYVKKLVETLQAHVLLDRATITKLDIPGSAGNMSAMHAILNRIAQNPGDVMKTEELAEELNMSPTLFCRTFKAITGKTPKQYALDIRIDRAKELLEASPCSAGMIAEQLGFSSQSHFNRVFRDVVGVPPIQYRLAFTGSGKQARAS
ncbi:AraC family transcriptional regulator [Hyphomonas polymorpha PS728]|uniref:AraC family transcriptional regulator n=1 Tax=Hyphomonas polymorpha PS728 TaxID=1280954 RepID=A0A062VDT7_9PROT|nr:AraC family transcriptional regulator [Hyphomonas polymorpha]KCZ97600.1 AraC family transcriptional regulator [Hyphomonas polymorpha PS728]